MFFGGGCGTGLNRFWRCNHWSMQHSKKTWTMRTVVECVQESKRFYLTLQAYLHKWPSQESSFHLRILESEGTTLHSPRTLLISVIASRELLDPMKHYTEPLLATPEQQCFIFVSLSNTRFYLPNGKKYLGSQMLKPQLSTPRHSSGLYWAF